MSIAQNFSVPRHVMAREVGDEAVILNLNTGTYFGLDPVGARMWRLLSEGKSLAEVCTRLTDEFDVGIDVVDADLRRLVDELLDRGLLISAG
jgi:hypothetical protein